MGFKIIYYFVSEYLPIMKICKCQDDERKLMGINMNNVP